MRTRLIALILLPVIPALALSVYTNFEQRATEANRIREGAVAMANLAAAKEENFVQNTRQLLRTLAGFPFLVAGTNRAFSAGNFANLIKLSPDYINFGLIETNGELFCSGIKTNGSLNFKDRSYFSQVLQTHRFAIGDFQIGRLSRQMSLNFGYPIFDENHAVRRVLFASLKLPLLTEVASRLDLPAGSEVTVFDRAGTILAHFPGSDEWVGKAMPEAARVKQAYGHGNGVFEGAGVDGIQRLYAITAISNGQSPSLFVTVGIPVEISFAEANQVLVRSIVVLGLVVILALGLARLFATHFVLNPVEQLVAAASHFSADDLAFRTQMRESAGELFQVGHAFDTMAEMHQKRQMEVLRAQSEISRINAELEQRVKDRTAQLTAINEELEAFSYSVSHDLRAPLRHIDGFATMLEKHAGESLDSKGQRYLKTIREAATRMGQLIDDLLMFCRMGRTEIRHESVDLTSLVQQVIEEQRQDTLGRNIQWSEISLPAVMGDRAALRQVFANLISNALKYSRTRDPARIDIGCADRSPEQTVIYVRDNGVGFDPAYAHKLFGVFQRLHTAAQFEGTGIGLAIVRRIVVRHGGRVWAEAKPEAGATFYFTLPDTKT